MIQKSKCHTQGNGEDSYISDLCNRLVFMAGKVFILMIYNNLCC